MAKNKIVVATVNPCNEFLVRHLIKLRGKPDKRSHDHKFFVYTTAIESVRKYPIPIICSDQLKLLGGIGDYLTKQLTNVIKQHYKKYLKPVQTQENGTEQTMTKIALSQNNQNVHIIQEQGTNTKTIMSNKSQTNKIYKPRARTQAFNILLAMRRLRSNDVSVSKKEINESLAEKQLGKISNWEGIKNTMMNAGYIGKDGQEDEYFITEKGLNYLEEAEMKEKSNVSKKKIQEEVEIMKASQELSTTLQKYMYEDSQTLSKKKQKLKIEEDDSLTLIIDNREIKDHQERDFFQSKFKQKYEIPVQTANLAIGDFAWMFGNQILNYIVERKKADDLASSILDGRYKEQKFRLKNSSIDNIFYLFEGHPSTTCLKTKKELDNALLKTSVQDGFKVIRTNAPNESAKFLAEMHMLLMQKIKYHTEEVETLGTIDEFNRRNGKSKNLTVENVFGLGLKVFPNVGKGTVNTLLKYFKSFRSLRQKLQGFGSEEERIQFLNSLLKGSRTQSISRMVVDLLLKQKYD